MTSSGLTSMSVDVKRAKPVRRSSHIDERSQVLRRRSIEKVLSAEAVVTGNVVSI